MHNRNEPLGLCAENSSERNKVASGYYLANYIVFKSQGRSRDIQEKMSVQLRNALFNGFENSNTR